MARKASFDDLVIAIQQAFIEVNDMSEAQHIRKLRTYFEEDGTPRVIEMQYPYFDEDGKPAYRMVSIPQICLVPITSLKLDSIDVDFKVQLYGEVDLKKLPTTTREELAEGNDGKKENDTFLGYIPHGMFQKRDDSYASIRLRFTSQDPPEGLMRLRDQYTKVTI